jgi:hypothetical protein
MSGNKRSQATSSSESSSNELLDFTKKNWYDWSSKFIPHIKTRFPFVGKMLETGIEPNFELAIPAVLRSGSRSSMQQVNATSASTTSGGSTSSRSTSNSRSRSIIDPDNQTAEEQSSPVPFQQSFEDQLEFELAKADYIEQRRIALREQAAFKKEKPAVCGELVQRLSDLSRTEIEKDPTFRTLIEKDDVLGLYNLMKDLHTVPRVAKRLQIANQSGEIYTMSMTKYKDFNAYSVAFTRAVNRLIALNRVPLDDDIVDAFLRGLTPDYAKYKRDRYEKDIVPATLAEAIRDVTEWVATGSLVGDGPSTDDSVSRRQQQQQQQQDDVAHYGDHKGGKGGSKPSSNKKKQGNKTAVEEKAKYCHLCADNGKPDHVVRCHNTKECRNFGKKATSEKKASNGRDKSTKEKVNVAIEEHLEDSDICFSAVLSQLNTANPDLSLKQSVDDAVLTSFEYVDSYDVQSPDVLVFDSGANVHVIRDAHLLSNICKRPAPRFVQGVYGESLRGDQDGHCDLLHSTAVYAPTAAANLVSHSKAEDDGFRIKLERHRGRSQYVMTRNGQKMVFRLSRRGLFLHKIHRGVAMMHLDTSQLPTLQRQRTSRHYTEEQINRALEAIVLHQILDHPSDAALCKALDNGVYLNCHLCSSDLRNARALYGNFCAGCVQGKMTRAAAAPSLSEPAQSVADTLHVDMFFILDTSKRKVPYLISVEETTGHTCVLQLASKSQKSVELGLSQVIAQYKPYGHSVKTIVADREHVFSAARNHLLNLGVELKQTSPEHHERRAERKIRTLKDHFRATLSQLPYKLPRCLYKQLVYHICSSLNLVPNSLSGARSPREIVTGKKVDMKTALRAPFGAIVLCKVPNQTQSQDSEPRAEYGVVVGRDHYSAGNIKVFLLQGNNMVVNRHRFTLVPHTKDMIDKLNSIAATDLATDSDELLQEPEQPSPQSSRLTDPEPDSAADQPEEQPFPEDVIVTPTDAMDDRGATTLNIPTDIVSDYRGDTTASAEPAVDASAPVSADTIEAAAEHRGALLPPPTPVDVDGTTETATLEPPAEPPPAPVTTTAHQQPSARNLRPTRSSWKDYGLHISLRRALALYDDKAKAAIMAELRQMIAMNVWTAVLKRDIPPEHRDKIIPSSMFLKEKFLPSGEFDKLKARLVANGNFQELSNLERKASSSPTVATASVMTVLAVAAKKKWKHRVLDFASAYLNAKLRTVTQYMTLSPTVSKVLLELQPEMARYLNPNGTITVKLQKALYGLVEAARLWYEHLSATLIELGFRKSTADNCVFIRTTESGEECVICLHVDDLLITGSSDEIIDELVRGLEKRYKGLSQQTGDTISYIGMQITFNRAEGSVTIRQPGYIDEMLKQHNVTGKAITPGTQKLFEVNPDSKPVNRTLFLSKLMKGMYLTKRTRPDALLEMTHLATRSAAPTEDDMAKLDRVYMYFNATRDLPLVLKPDSLDLFASVDASYGNHVDSKGHSGIVLTLGLNGGPIFAQSCKQKIVTKSSTEAELVALNDGVSQIMWTRNLLRDLGIVQDKPTVVFQDNQSTIQIAAGGPGQKGRTKHMDIRYFYVSERLQNKDIVLQYQPTADMVADILTKPLGGAHFSRLRAVLLNNE